MLCTLLIRGPFAALLVTVALAGACVGPQHHGQVAAPTPMAPDVEADDDEAQNLDGPALGAGEWLDQAFMLWHDEHYAACVAALRQALATQELNDAGQAMAYWHIYLCEQTMGHHGTAQNALADFVAVADAMAAEDSMRSADSPERKAFAERFDLAGRLARARATLNLAWAKQVHRAGRSPGYPLLVFDETELAHFMELVPPCGQAHDRRIVQHVRQTDAFGRPTAKVTLQCHRAPKGMHYFFAFIGDHAPVNLLGARAARRLDPPVVEERR